MSKRPEMSNRLTRLSKFLAYALRHQPEAVGLTLDTEGWVSLDEMLTAANKNGNSCSLQDIQEVVDNCEKKRYAISGNEIRAVQGHSTAVVAITYVPITPPEFLYHGTATRFLESIKQQGLIAGSRHHVHLSGDIQTATSVGMRHGVPTILTISASDMHQDGYEFYKADNGVWLTTKIPVEYISFPKA